MPLGEVLCPGRVAVVEIDDTDVEARIKNELEVRVAPDIFAIDDGEQCGLVPVGAIWQRVGPRRGAPGR